MPWVSEIAFNILIDQLQTYVNVNFKEQDVYFVCLFDFCFTALQHILGHFGRGQLP